MLASGVAFDERQQKLLMTLKQSMEKESNKNNIDNKINETKLNNEVINFRTNDKLHSNDIIMNKINYNTEERKPQRMEIWYVNFGRKNGSIQSGIRPCLTSSNPINNKYSNIRNVYPITSKLDKSSIPVHVKLDISCGLKEESLVLIEQVTTIDIRYDLMYYVGTVDEITMAKVDMARNIQLGDLQEKTALERLPQNIQNMINDKLEDIRGLERTISNIKRESLINHLMEEREANLLSLQRICKKYDLDYKNYYVMYRKEEEKVVI